MQMKAPRSGIAQAGAFFPEGGCALKGHIHSVETFGTVDGPGVRFVVFFQGCPMRCLYCHNPDTWEQGRGEEVTADSLLEQFTKNRAFYRNGGITCTGGEPMLQLGFLTELFAKAHEQGIHTCLDTSGICFDPDNTAPFERLLACTDLVMLDIKHIDDDIHKHLTGHSNRRILQFAEYISAQKTDLWIRHVIVPGFTDSGEEQSRLGYFIGGLRTLKAVDVLPYHDMGKKKYLDLGIPYPLADTQPVTKEQAQTAYHTILSGIKKRLRDNAAGI